MKSKNSPYCRSDEVTSFSLQKELQNHIAKVPGYREDNDFSHYFKSTTLGYKGKIINPLQITS
jgi:hypothetical protein